MVIQGEGTHKGCPYGGIQQGGAVQGAGLGTHKGVPLRAFARGAGRFRRLLVLEAANADGEQDGRGGEEDSYFGEDVGEAAVVPDEVLEGVHGPGDGERWPMVCMNWGTISSGHQAPPRGASDRDRRRTRPLA